MTAYNILAKSLVGRKVLIKDRYVQIMKVISIRGWGWNNEIESDSGIDIEVRLKGTTRLYIFSIDEICK